jgi:hypothetical protein
MVIFGGNQVKRHRQIYWHGVQYQYAPPWRLTMAIARAQLVDTSLTRWYHCVTRCVRRAFHRGEGDHNRKEWIENRLEELAEVFAVAVGGFSREALLTISVYVDLNPVAGKVAETPETSDYTSIKQRVDHSDAQGKTSELEATKDGSVAGSRAAAGLEESLWLCPIEDRRGLDSTREGMIRGFSLGSYVNLVEYTGRIFRDGKASISEELAGIFERLN